MAKVWCTACGGVWCSKSAMRKVWCKGYKRYNNIVFSKLGKRITFSPLGNNNLWLWRIPCVLLAPYALYILLHYGKKFVNAFYAGANIASYDV